MVAFSGIDGVQGAGPSDESGGAAAVTSGVTGPRAEEVGRAGVGEEGCGRAASGSIRTTISSRCSRRVHIGQPGRRGLRQEPWSPDTERGEESSYRRHLLWSAHWLRRLLSPLRPMEGRVVATLSILLAPPSSLAARGSCHLATAGNH